MPIEMMELFWSLSCARFGSHSVDGVAVDDLEAVCSSQRWLLENSTIHTCSRASAPNVPFLRGGGKNFGL